MAYAFQLSCESTVDLPYSYVSGRELPVLFYSYSVDGQEYMDDMGRDPQALPNFYHMLAEGKMPSTSQINTFRYLDYFRELLAKGDVLHICFGTGMTPSYNNAVEAAQQLREEFPDRKLILVDSTCSCCGYGLIVDEAADMRDAGKNMEEIEAWLNEKRWNVHHQFFSTDLKYFRRSGRVSGAAATVGTVLGICPLMHLDHSGHIIAYSKVRGKKNAIKETVAELLRHAENGAAYSGKCFLGHSNCLEDAMAVKAAVEEAMPNIKGGVRVYNIGTIIASHCGPGTVAVFLFGDERVK